MSSLPIRRLPRPRGFTQLDNTLLRNPALSFKARGILCHLLSHADDWIIRMSELEKGVDRSTAIRSGIDELIAAGYMRRSRVRDAAGRFLGWEFEVWDTPDVAAAAVTETRFSAPGKPDLGESGVGKSSPKNNNGKNTKSEEEVVSLRDTTGAVGSVDQPPFSFAPTTPQPPAPVAASPNNCGLRIADCGSASPKLPTPNPKPAAPAAPFPWAQVSHVFARLVPGLHLPPKAVRHHHAIGVFWRKYGCSLDAVARLAERVQASDFIMARHGWPGRNHTGQPYPWSWIFSRRPGTGEWRFDLILDGFYDNQRMAELRRTTAEFPGHARHLDVCFVDGATGRIDTAERLSGGQPRWALTGQYVNGLPEAIDCG